MADSAYFKLPFWRGSGGKSGPGAFLKAKLTLGPLGEKGQKAKMKVNARPKKVKMKGNERPKKAKMKGNEGPKGQNARKSRPKRRK